MYRRPTGVPASWHPARNAAMIRDQMDPERARAIAERWHCVDREEDGTPLLLHVRRVAWSAPADARALAWLHELLEWTSIDERELLAEGLSSDELRTLRLLKRQSDSRSTIAYLGHLRLIAVAAGDSGRLARAIKLADLEDRRRYPRVRLDGWTPPYAHGLQILHARSVVTTGRYRGGVAPTTDADRRGAASGAH